MGEPAVEFFFLLNHDVAPDRRQTFQERLGG